LQTVIQYINLEKFSIAFFGSYSDGKSTILSALTKRLDIKIAPGPTTDEIREYEYKDFFIIDTPGLFSEKLMHDEKTKRYISEANIVIYTVDPVNPLKESHHKILKWLFDDMGKIKSTIFAVNKMDSIADLEDEDDFLSFSRIKTKVVLDTLHDIVRFENEPAVVCIAGDPYKQGLDFWLQRPEEYKSLSRIEKLVDKIEKFVDEARENLILLAGKSVIMDTVNQVVKQLNDIEKIQSDKVELLETNLAEIESKARRGEKDITRNHMNIRQQVIDLRRDILQALWGADNVLALREVITTEIGSNGIILEEKINNIIRKNTEEVLKGQERLVKSISTTISFYQEINSELMQMAKALGGKLGDRLLMQSTKELSAKIINLRDITKLPIKFKPWGATKWAQKITSFGKFLKALPIIIETANIIIITYTEFKFNKEKAELEREVKELFQEFLETFTCQEYINTYCSAYKEVIRNKDELATSINEIKSELHKIRKAITELKFLNCQ